MSAEDQSAKQYEPSQKKLDDARKRGEVAKSPDLTTAAAYAGLYVAMGVFGAGALLHMGAILQTVISDAAGLSQVIFDGEPMPVMGAILFETAMAIAVIFVLPTGFALVALIGQRALVFAPSKLAPKMNRISPLSGFKNKFGRQGLFDFAKSTTKLLIYCIVLGAVVAAQSDRIVGSAHMPSRLVAVEMGRLILLLLSIVVVVAGVIGVIDLLWQRAEHIRKHKMSRKEITDEQKQAEGDPMLKEQRRQKGAEIAMNKMLTDVPDADVVIVNPTHYAVALKWDRSELSAPTCVAKGVDEVAAKIREIAAEHSIPLHSDPPTARALHAAIEIGAQIRPQDYAAVAAAIRFAETVRKKARP